MNNVINKEMLKLKVHTSERERESKINVLRSGQLAEKRVEEGERKGGRERERALLAKW